MNRHTKSQEQRALKAWDRRPWPKAGDADENTLYAAVGRALSSWERYEAQLAFLFSQFMCTPTLRAPIRAYCAVRTFQGRADMLRAASESFFWGFGIDKKHKLVADFKSVLSNACKFDERRNDIAHGVVDHYQPMPNASTDEWVRRNGYALFPAYGSLKERDQAGVPAYCYTSGDLDYFSQQFASLHEPARVLASEIMCAHNVLQKSVSSLPRRLQPPFHK